MNVLKTSLVPVVVIMFSVAAWANSITIGLPGAFNNIAPFGRLPNGTTDGTRYQQAYSAADFSGLGTINISGFGFLGGTGGNFAPGTYNFYFSTITPGIDDLSNTDFDSNLGANYTFFTSVYLSGASPSELSFSGAPFLYDPLNGNLLLDVIISQDGPQPPGRIATYQLNRNAPGVFSRYDNFATGNIGYGLVTKFDYTSVPDTMNTFTGLFLAAVIISGFRCWCGDPPGGYIKSRNDAA
jgi:hypothetical protein